MNNNNQFELSNLRYTKQYYAGEIYGGAPLSTSVEVNIYNNIEKQKKCIRETITHTYYSGFEFDKDKKTKTIEIDNDNLLNELSNIKLYNLKNNYFTDLNPERLTSWVLEYNDMFKVVGTFDQEPDEIKGIKTLLNIDNLIDSMLQEVKEEISTN